MTAPLPPLPVKKLATQCGISIGSSDGSPYPKEEQLRKFGERCAKLAVREALERARLAVKEAKENAFSQSADEAIRAMIEEYK